jgi:hypothetical protein
MNRVTRKSGRRLTEAFATAFEHQITDALRAAERDGRRTGLLDAARALYARAEALPAVDGRQLQVDALNAAAGAVLEIR